VASRTEAKKYHYADIVLEHLPVGVAVYDAQEFRLLEANTLFLTNLEPFLDPCWQQERAIGHTLAELEICNFMDIFRSVAESAEAYRGEALPLATLQGQLTYWDWTLDLIEDGENRHLLQTMTNVTAQVQERRQALQGGEMCLHALLDQLPEGIIIAKSEDDLINYVNPAAAYLLKTSLPCLLGSSVHKFTPGDGSKNDGPGGPWNRYLIEALRGETIKSQEAVITLHDGSNITVLLSGVPLFMTLNGQKSMTGAVIAFQDITTQKSMEQHKNDFLAIANHELRTPITIIQGFAELLKMTQAEEDALSDFTHTALTYIIDQSEHLARLIEAMLDISKIDQCQFELKREPHDLLALLTGIIKSQGVVAKNHRFQLQLEGIQERDKVICMFDRQSMIQAFSNLMNNAVKYSPGAGEIETGLRVVEDMQGQQKEVLIWVKDHGIGIAPAEIPHIFDRFYRGSTLDGYISGFGIGLYLVKEIITRHSGCVWVESVQNAGSTFYVSLPLLSIEQESSV